MILRADAFESTNIPVIPTQFEVAVLWESGSLKVEGKFIKTRYVLQSVDCTRS